MVEAPYEERRLPLDLQRAIPIAVPHRVVYGCYPDAGRVKLILNIEALTVHFEKASVREVVDTISQEMIRAPAKILYEDLVAEASVKEREAHARASTAPPVIAVVPEKLRKVTEPAAQIDAEDRAKAEEEARLRKEAEARQRAEEERRQKAEKETQERLEEEAIIRRAEEERAKAEEEARLRKEAEARQRAEEERRQKAEKEVQEREREEGRRRAAIVEAEEARKRAEEPIAELDEEGRRRAEAERAKAGIEERKDRKTTDAVQIAEEVDRIAWTIGAAPEKRAAGEEAFGRTVPSYTAPEMRGSGQEGLSKQKRRFIYAGIIIVVIGVLYVSTVLIKPRKEIRPFQVQEEKTAVTKTPVPEAELIIPKIPKTEKDTEAMIHIVKKGDTLWAISKHYTGNPFNYPRVAKHNRIPNPDLIFPEQKISLEQEEYTTKP
jgi:nucleoid-associated protein YgaU